MSAAARFSCRCATSPDFGTAIIPGFRSTHASASCAAEQPACCAILASAGSSTRRPCSTGLRDIIEKHGDRLNPLLERLAQLHRDDEASAQIIVSTAHKAKGREWDSVVVLDDFEPPAELAARRRDNAGKAEEADQQINLLYVACTRVRRHLQLAPRLYDALC